MGATASSEFSSTEIQEFTKYYSLVKSSYDYRFGQVSIYQNNESRQLILVNTRTFETTAQRNEFVQELRRKQITTHPSVSKIVGYSLASGSNICGLTSSVTIYSEFYQDDLLRELRARSRTGERYSEQEVWYLLETLVSALAFQQEQNTAHGDINAQNVILTNNGQAKILNNGLVSLHSSNFVRRLQGQTNLYMAPEALELVQTKFVSPQYNVYKADVYSLGVTMLYVMLLQDPISIYNFSLNRVYHEQVDALLNQALGLYSYQLVDLLRNMLMQDPTKRPSAMELRGQTGVRPAQVRAPQQQVVQQPLLQSQLVQQPTQLLTSQPQTFAPQQVVQSQAYQPLNQSLIRGSLAGGPRRF